MMWLTLSKSFHDVTVLNVSWAPAGIVSWLVGFTFFSRTALTIFLIFCMKLHINKRKKLTEPDFPWKRVNPWFREWRHFWTPAGRAQLWSWSRCVNDAVHLYYDERFRYLMFSSLREVRQLRENSWMGVPGQHPGPTMDWTKKENFFDWLQMAQFAKLTG